MKNGDTAEAVRRQHGAFSPGGQWKADECGAVLERPEISKPGNASFSIPSVTKVEDDRLFEEMDDVLSGPTRARYWYQDGLEFREGVFDLPRSTAADFPSCYVFAFPKSGSVLLNNLAAALMEEVGVPTTDVASILFSKGISKNSVVLDLKSIFRPHGRCYLGFRALLPAMRGNLHHLAGPKVLLVRDPRDMLVSLYFSLKFSHVFPDDGTRQFSFELQTKKDLAEKGLDDFCLSCATFYNQTFFDYREMMKDPSFHVLRYEDIVFKKLELARHLCDLFSIRLEDERLHEIVGQFEVIPGIDRPHDHVRQVYPGDHRRKLRAKTSKALNVILSDFLATFGYPA